MKIKLAILEKDTSYLNRIVSVFSTKYADKFRLYSFTDSEIAILSIGKEKIDVLLANDSFEIEPESLPKRCSLAYFVDNLDIESIKGQRAVCRYQKPELIYKQILSIYSENAGRFADFKLADDNCIVYTFSSPCGGTGTSCAAAACAMRLAFQGKRVFYLNLNPFDLASQFFSGDGQFGMSDVIFTLKSKKANLAMKLESYVKQDSSGVFFFSPSVYAVDMFAMRQEDRMKLLSELKVLGAYDYIVVDIGFGLDKDHIALYNKSNCIIMVSDGSETANIKVERAFSALQMLEQDNNIAISGRFFLLYNRFGSKTGKLLDEEIELRNIGGAPVYANATCQQVVAQLMNKDVFDHLA